MKHQPVTDHLKTDAPLWKRLARPSMPEWTPAKVATVFVLGSFMLAIGMAFFPSAIRTFTATSASTPAITLSDVTLSAFDGLSVTERHSRGTSRTYSPIGGVTLEGRFTNNSSSELFVYDSRISRFAPPSQTTDSNLDVSDWLRTFLEMKGATFTKNWNQVSGYIVAPNQSVDFRLTTANFKVDPDESVKNFNMGTYFRFIEIENRNADTLIRTLRLLMGLGGQRVQYSPNSRVSTRSPSTNGATLIPSQTPAQDIYRATIPPPSFPFRSPIAITSLA